MLTFILILLLGLKIEFVGYGTNSKIENIKTKKIFI